MKHESSAAGRTTWLKTAGATLALSLFTAAAAFWPGYENQLLPVTDSGVWVLQTESGRYAKVNSRLGEVVTVKDAPGVSGVVQNTQTGILYMNTRFAAISAAQPKNFSEGDIDALPEIPATTAQTLANDEFIVYLGTSSDITFSRFGDGGQTLRSVSLASDDQDAPEPLALSAVLSRTGELVLLAEVGEQLIVYRIDLARSAVQSSASLEGFTPGGQSSPVIALSSQSWVVVHPEAAQLWFEGSSTPQPLASQNGSITAELHPQRGQAETATVYFSAADGLYALDTVNQEIEQIVEHSGALVTAQPFELDGVQYAAWGGSDSVTFWNSTLSDPLPLDTGGRSFAAGLDLAFVSNGTTAVLNELVTGLVWTLPTGDLIPSTLNWSLSASSEGQEVDENTVSTELLEQRPPVAHDDSFGVRAGQLNRLPVLQNDTDPNNDVLAIVPEQLTQPGPGAGPVTVVANRQELAIDVPAGASGTFSFQYAITDGIEISEPAQVVLTVISEEKNLPPLWCDDNPDCSLVWTTPELIVGGSVSFDIAQYWQDPEGDSLFVKEVRVQGAGSAAWTPTGIITYKHPSLATEGGLITLTTVVSDLQGAEAQRDIQVLVTASPNLRAEQFAASGLTGEELLLDPSLKVSGNIGALRFSTTRVISAASSGAAVTVSPDGKFLLFTAPNAGTYVITYTVSDNRDSASSKILVTVSDRGSTQITAAPGSAFIPAGEDITLDLTTLVSNPAGSPVLISDLNSRPATGTQQLSAQLVDHHLLRISGSRADTKAGFLGTISYRATDPSGAVSGQALGRVNVYALDATSPAAPVLLDDHVTVRAGTLVDIPVLDNDRSHGNSLLMLSDSVNKLSPDDPGLVYSDGRMIRYVAPETPGNYQVYYRASSQGNPGQVAEAVIHIRVIPSSRTNTAPEPAALFARVSAGQSVQIIVDLNGLDPDGDQVMLDRILRQPQHGIASLSADGTRLIYQSFKTGFEGEDSFDYQVKDALGETGSATVRVAVVPEGAGSSGIITYNDYLSAQISPGNSVIVSPLNNDLELSGSALYLVLVEPDVPSSGSGSGDDTEIVQRYQRIAALIGEITDHRTVRVSVPAEPGTVPLKYWVSSVKPGSAGYSEDLLVSGQILLTASADAPLDYPKIHDTVIDLGTVDQLRTGIDVISGKVQWSSGEISRLDSLELIGAHPGVSLVANSFRIQAEVGDSYRTIPFRVFDSSAEGTAEAVGAYGFLKIPGANDLRLTLRADAPEFRVEETLSGTVQLGQLMSLPQGTSLEVQAGEVRASGARPGATCSVSGTELSYFSATGQPWRDHCVVPVKLSTQEEYSYLAVPVRIAPQDPIPTLRPATIEVIPGEGQERSFSFFDVLGWEIEGRESPNVAFRYRVVPEDADRLASVLPELSESGTGPSINFHVHGGAVAGTTLRFEIFAELTVNGNFYSASDYLTLTVANVPVAVPVGGTFNDWNCSNDGTALSCELPVIAEPGSGEYNPLGSRYPLVLTGVDSTAEGCTDVRFTVQDESLLASWQSSTPGYQNCSVTFQVEDAQGRPGTGSAVLDLRGKPEMPSVEQVRYGDQKAMIRITQPQPSYPEVLSYQIRYTDRDGVQQELNVPLSGSGCTTAEGCSVTLTNLQNSGGLSNQVQVKAINQVNESEYRTRGVQAYRHSLPREFTVTPAFSSDTTVSTGILNIALSGGVRDFEVNAYLLGDQNSGYSQLINSETFLSGGTVQVSAPAGVEHQFTLTPQNMYGAPPTHATVFPGELPSESSTTFTFTPIGSPKSNGITLGTTVSDTSITINTQGLVPSTVANGAGAGSLSYRYYVGDGPAPVCSTTPTGGFGAEIAALSSSTTVSIPTPRSFYTIALYISNGYGCAAVVHPQQVFAWDEPAASTIDFRYTLGYAGAVTGSDPLTFSYAQEVTSLSAVDTLADPDLEVSFLQGSTVLETLPATPFSPSQLNQLSARYRIIVAGSTIYASDTVTPQLQNPEVVQPESSFTLVFTEAADSCTATNEAQLSSSVFTEGVDYTVAAELSGTQVRYTVTWLGSIPLTPYTTSFVECDGG